MSERTLAEPSRKSSAATRGAWLVLAVVGFLAFFWRLGGNGLFDLDEGLYTEAAREMHLSGDWVVPRVNQAPFFEKPPLIYWEAAALFSFGRSELTARLPSALATALLVLLLAGFGMRVFGARAGMLAGFFFALSPLVLAESRQLITDATLDLWIAAALIAFFWTQVRVSPPGDAQPEADAARRAWGGRLLAFAFWAACGLGVLTKGLPGILVPCVTALVYLLLRHRGDRASFWAGLRAMRPGWGVLLFLLIALPWHVAAWLRAGGAFTGEYIIKQHLGRLRGGDTAHLAPFWFYVPVFFLGALPWGVLFPTALCQRLRAQGEAPAWSVDEMARLLLKVWAIAVLVMFSVSGSKLVSYILPMLPPAALLSADWWVRTSATRARRAIVAGLGLAAVLAACVAAVLLFREPIAAAVAAQTHRPVHLETVPAELFTLGFWLVAAALAGIAGCLTLTVAGRPRWAVRWLIGGMAATAAVAVFGLLPAINRAFLAPLHDLAHEAGRLSEPDRPVLLAIGPPGHPSALFYLPDRLLQPGGAAPRVVATNKEPEIHAFLAAHPNAVVLTDGKNAAKVSSVPRMRVEDESGELRIMEE